MKELGLVFCISLLTSCAKLHLKSTTERTLDFQKIEKHEKPVKIVVQKNFYLWGVLPQRHVLDIGTEMYDQGVAELSGLVVKEIDTEYNSFLSIISFGMFIPRTYSIEGKTSYQYSEDPKDGEAL